MSFVFGSNSASTGYNLTRSLRFRSSATAYLDRTPASASNRRTFTWSAWVKTSRFKGQIFTAGKFTGPGGDVYGLIMLNNSTSQLQLNIVVSGVGSIIAQTPAVFRDPSSWYHFVVAVDTTQATNSNGVKMYVNGVQQTLTFSVYTQNQLTEFNNTTTHNFGQLSTLNDEYFDGYLAEVNFIDGQQLAASSFGSTNALTGVWQPAAYTGTYGTNGFYLPFTSIGSASTSSYSAGFNGTSQYLTYPNSSNFAFGTAAFTIEFFINGASNNDKFILGGRSAIGTMGITTGGFAGSTVGALRYFGSSTIVSTNVITDSSYHHCAIVRDGSSNVKLYVDGALVASGTDTTNYTTTSGTWYIGTNDISPGSNLLSAALSNLRIVKGTAVYTAAFTPPSAPLTAVSGTSLLTLQSSTIIDNSGNSVSISNTGTVVTSVSYPFVGNVGADFSGNNNNWSTNNISLNAGVTYDSMTDVPTLTSATAANFAVLNPLFVNSTTTLANGNLQASGTNATAVSTIAPTSGKWYAEITYSAIGGGVPMVWVTNKTAGSISGGGGVSDGMQYYNDGRFNNAGTETTGFATWTTSDVMGMAVNCDSGTVAFYKNNTLINTLTNTGFFSGKAIAIGATHGSTPVSNTWAANFGQRPFAYTPPTGFVALNTYNLPTSTIVKGNTVMDATLYTGNGSTQTITNAAAFKPDLVWVKTRSSGSFGHALFDSVRGAPRRLASNLTEAENTTGSFGQVSSFDSNGFTVATGSSSFGETGANALTYVGWQWQAGQGTTSSNTNGTITSTVSVNASAGFSVVTYTGTGANATVGHGLGVAPSMVIVKSRSASDGWPVYHVSLTSAAYIVTLNTTNAQSSVPTVWNSTAPTSSVFSIGTSTGTNTGSTTYVAYCWTPIAGFSAFGSYTGNGSTDGPFVYLGFRPKWVMVKASSAAENWPITDSARSPFNAANAFLRADESSAETTGAMTMDFNSNGFKMRTADGKSNGSGITYIYIAFAENPFKNALAR